MLSWQTGWRTRKLSASWLVEGLGETPRSLRKGRGCPHESVRGGSWEPRRWQVWSAHWFTPTLRNPSPRHAKQLLQAEEAVSARCTPVAGPLLRGRRHQRVSGEARAALGAGGCAGPQSSPAGRPSPPWLGPHSAGPLLTQRSLPGWARGLRADSIFME